MPVTSTVTSDRLLTSTIFARKILADLHHLGPGRHRRPLSLNSASSRASVSSGSRSRILKLAIDELVKLLGHLVDRVDGSVERERDPRGALVIGRTDGERVDVEPAAREQPRDPGQDTGLVLHQDREDVLAARALSGDCLELVEGDQFLGGRLRPPIQLLLGCDRRFTGVT